MSLKRRQLEAKRRRLIRRFEKLAPWIQGSLVSTERICGKANCACRRGGAKHPVLFVTWKEEGKTVSLYVPRKMESEVKSWAENYKKLKELVLEISDIQKQIIRLRED